MRRVASTPLTCGIAMSMMTSVGLSCQGQANGFRAVAGLPDDLHIGLLVEDEPEALADHRVVIG